MKTTVINLRTQEEVIYIGISPEDAVRAAYAQERCDFNSWNYGDRYGTAATTERVASMGDWAAIR